MSSALPCSVLTAPRSSRAGAFVSFGLGLGALCIASTSALAAPNDPTGLWSTKDDESIIEIAPCGESYCGTLVWLKEPNETDGTPKADALNEDETLRGRPLVGIVLLTELAPEKTKWRGKAYNADDGKTYEITFKPGPSKAPGEKAEIEGCILKILCQSETFTRIETIPGMEPAPPPVATTKSKTSSKASSKASARP
jgi:uncharacterized protein (DUF2147 family)